MCKSPGKMAGSQVTLPLSVRSPVQLCSSLFDFGDRSCDKIHTVVYRTAKEDIVGYLTVIQAQHSIQCVPNFPWSFGTYTLRGAQ